MNEQEALEITIEHLKKGNIVLFPSDTVWGLSCDATNSEAVDRLIQLKKRGKEKSFIVLVNSDRMVNQCIGDIPSVAWDMMDFTEKPLTLVLDRGQYVAGNAINEDGSLGIRMVKSGVVKELIRKFNRPIISTSANFSGSPAPKQFAQIEENLKNEVDFIYPLDQNKPVGNNPSKIVRIRVNGEVEILRK